MPSRLKLEDVAKFFTERGATLVSDTYVNGKTTIKYLCYCGSSNIHETTYERFKKHQTPHKCPDCLGRNGFPTRLKYDDVVEIFAEAGCKLISKTYNNNKERLEYYCNCGHHEICRVTLMTFQLYGTNCANCRNSRMVATNQERFGVDYVSQREWMKDRTLSGICEYIEAKKLLLEDVRALFLVQNLELLEDVYVNTVTKMIYRCLICGNVNKICAGKVKYSNEGCNSRECINLKLKATCNKRFNADSYSQTQEFKDRYKAISLERYGVEHPLQNTQILNKLQTTNMIRWGFPCNFENELVKEKIKQGCMDRFGVEWYSQTNLVKEKTKITNLNRYGFEVSSKNNLVLEKMKATNLERYGVPFTQQNPIIYKKHRLTLLDRYGLINVSQIPEVKSKKIITSNLRYNCDYPMQNSIIAMRSQDNSLKLKSYVLPSGREIILQGYEPQVMNVLLKRFDENDIITNRNNVPEIWYCKDDGKYHRYYVDFFLHNENIVIEVKSTWTYQIGKKELRYKMLASQYLGYKFVLFIFDKLKLINHSDILESL